MKSKLHFGILIVLFIFLGRYVESTVSANQQIVIQFSDTDISTNNVQSTIETIQKKLQKIGAEHIKVGHHQDGQLKITYYSSDNVEQIKKILSKEQDLKFAFSSTGNSNNLPKQEDPKDYQLNISEIQNSGNSNNWDFEGVEVVELNHKSDRFNNLKVNTTGSLINSELTNDLVWFSVKLFSIDKFTIDYHSYKTPEVRAAPMA